jgi:hypothetical protein
MNTDYPSQDLGPTGADGRSRVDGHENDAATFGNPMRSADTSRHGDGMRAPTPTYEPIPCLDTWQDQRPGMHRDTSNEAFIEPMGDGDADWDDVTGR